MRTLLLSFFIIGSCFYAKSQVLELYNHDSQVLINNGDTIKLDGLYTESEIVAHINVKNISASQVSVKCKKRHVIIDSNTTNTFCWADLCYPPSSFDPGVVKVLNPSQVDSTGFSGHYNPNDHNVTGIVRYIFYTTTGDSAWVNFRYVNGPNDGVNDNTMFSSSMSFPYPNPAINVVNVNYTIANNAEVVLQVYNICGKIEKQHTLTNTYGVSSINVSDLPSGIYFCSFNVNGSIVKTKRFVVSH